MSVKLPLTPAGRFWVGYFMVLVLIFSLSLSGCSGLSLESKANAAYGSFVASEKFGAELIKSSEVSDDTKARIKAADAIAKPAADLLLSEIMAYRVSHANEDSLKSALHSALPSITTLATETAK